MPSPTELPITVLHCWSEAQSSGSWLLKEAPLEQMSNFELTLNSFITEILVTTNNHLPLGFVGCCANTCGNCILQISLCNFLFLAVLVV